MWQKNWRIIWNRMWLGLSIKIIKRKREVNSTFWDIIIMKIIMLFIGWRYLNRTLHSECSKSKRFKHYGLFCRCTHLHRSWNIGGSVIGNILLLIKVSRPSQRTVLMQVRAMCASSQYDDDTAPGQLKFS